MPVGSTNSSALPLSGLGGRVLVVGSPESKVAVQYVLQFSRGDALDWKTMLADITGSVDQELLVRNEQLMVENRILRNQIQVRLGLIDAESRSTASG